MTDKILCMQNFMPLQSIEDLSKLIIERRKTAGLTQTQAAQACGVSISFMNKLENAKPTIQFGLVFKVLTRLGIDLGAHGRPVGKVEPQGKQEWIELDLY